MLTGKTGPSSAAEIIFEDYLVLRAVFGNARLSVDVGQYDRRNESPAAPEHAKRFSQRGGRVGEVLFGQWFLRPFLPPSPARPGILHAFANFNGRSYVDIVDAGYSFTRGKPSNVAFFPAYPALGAIIRKITRLPTVVALLIVSHGCLAAAFVVLYR